MQSLFVALCCAIVLLAPNNLAFVPSPPRDALARSVSVGGGGGGKQWIQLPVTLPSVELSMAMNDDDDKNVNVNLVEDVDAFTLTAVGFGLIAFNFLVLANMGDAGLAGFVARIINTFSN
ncbi:hypothetical protein HJC23_003279 [Cyclotella cryptica]|uniref:Uncharacterized protein n=1 Tax=Cyclotella cryptica TaxID=29204 RepID=A0ABD3QZA0_9STRA|eukprot:CCRYP_000822-RA/>CCRYP_000822-RA protein AED:0.01 eAED:0.01 QI:104/1/1/1/1/1/2/2951/119